MLFKSAYADFQVLVRSEVINFHPATGVEVGRFRALTANFGTHGGTFNSPDPLTGEIVEHAIIHGHFYDSEAAQNQFGYTDEERESIEAAIMKIAEQQPFLVAVVDQTPIPADAPWPTYDGMPAKDVVALAERLGLVREALRYEEQNQARTTLLTALEDLIIQESEREKLDPKVAEPEAITL